MRTGIVIALMFTILACKQTSKEKSQQIVEEKQLGEIRGKYFL